jgi:hypothetical protein
VGADAGCSAMRLFGVVGVEGLGYVPTPRIEGDFFLTSLRGVGCGWGRRASMAHESVSPL